MLQPRIRPQTLSHRLPFLYPSLALRNYASQGHHHPDHSEGVPPPPPLTVTSTTPSQPYVRESDSELNGIRTYKPRTPGVRHLRRPINDHLWKGRPFKALTFPRKGHGIGGRNVTGHITMRHRGGGHKRRIRMVDFDRWEPGKHTVERIEYDPGRSAHIALLKRNETGKLSYIIAPQGMRAGEVVESFRQGVPQELLDSLGGSTDAGMIASKTAWRGNCLPLHMIPSGTIVYCVGLYNGKGAQLCRSAGTFGMVVNKNDEDIKKRLYVDVRLKSGEVRMIHRNACATVGIASNSNHFRRQLGKAGRSRWLGIRPTVRGLAMNANEHPHGGGRGKSKGNVISQSIWGTLAKGGFKTRKKSNVNRFVVTPRPQGTRPKAEKKSRKK
ncbi:54S ribosomal protein RML2 [Physcia stellaris]|nr:54S ribosomal protein RML2 [Physcia stellaris]